MTARGSMLRTTPGSESERTERMAQAIRKLVHTLNNDLTLALGMIELLAEEQDLSTTSRQMAQDALASLHRLKRHIEDLDNSRGIVP